MWRLEWLMHLGLEGPFIFNFKSSRSQADRALSMERSKGHALV